jgi:hypothetical protein
MAKFIEFESYDILHKKTSKKMINVENIIELEDHTIGEDILTRVFLSNNDSFDLKMSVEDVQGLIES